MGMKIHLVVFNMVQYDYLLILRNELDELNGSSYVNEYLDYDVYSMEAFAHIKVLASLLFLKLFIRNQFILVTGHFT